jgi:hypothetical protein
MPAPLIRKGDRIRLKVCCIDGWKGYGYALNDELDRNPDAVIDFRREGIPDDQDDCCIALRSQVVLCRQQEGRS